MTAILLGMALAVGVTGMNPAISQATNPPQQINVLIGFTNTPGPNEQALVRSHGGTVKYSYHLVPAIAASIPESAITGLLNNPNVSIIDLDGTVYSSDIELENSWGVNRIGSGTVHDAGNNGAGVKVAILDTGIDYTHAELDANYVGGYDFVNGDADPMDDNGHGTQVAGVVAAEDNGVGVVGVAPGASLYALKVLNASGSGFLSEVIAALQWAVDNGIQVTNNSYGIAFNPGDIIQAAFDNSAAQGILHVAAAGNSGIGDNTVLYPALYDSVIAVGATDPNNNRAVFSSTGIKVELAAPGVSINSTQLGGGYVLSSGTSIASPHAAGSAALLIAANIADTNGNGLINDEIRQTLDSTTLDLGTVGRDPFYGFGLINIAAAVASLVPVPPPTTGTISGMVTDATTLIPISGATVTDGVRTTTTDVNGLYMLTSVPAGTYTVTASASGYETASQGATVIADATTTVDFALAVLYGAIGGTVTDATTLNPISGATVTDGVRTTTTDVNGLYMITGVPAGVYTVTASAVNYVGVSQTGITVTGGSSSIVNFSLQAEVVEAIVNSIAYSTSGGRNNNRDLLTTITLVDSFGGTVSGASITINLFRNGNIIWSGTSTTGSNGAVIFTTRNARSGYYTTTITGVSATGLIWNGVTPLNGFTK